MSNLILNGKSKASGGTFEEVKIDGLSSIKGDLVCDTMEADGICEFNGNVRVNGKAEIDGVCKIYGDMDTEDLDVDGVLSVKGSVTAENARLNGTPLIEGTFNIGSLDLKFYNSPRVKEVVGGRIHIRHGTNTRYFKAELVEGDDIYLERSKIKVVRGDSVVIGEGCTVDRAEYRSELNIRPKAVVKERIKLN
jgi:cytoskeletal protein CcmA (bactofilin family)